MSQTWSEWHRFAELAKNPAENCKAGVYQIRATTEDHRPVSIPRACAPDADGILYIGQGFLPDRVGLLMEVFKNEPKGHHQFTTVFREYGLERIANRRFLEIRWMECEKPAAYERRLIYEYKKRTGDMPPGNRKLDTPPVDPNADVEEE